MFQNVRWRSAQNIVLFYTYDYGWQNRGRPRGPRPLNFA